MTIFFKKWEEDGSNPNSVPGISSGRGRKKMMNRQQLKRLDLRVTDSPSLAKCFLLAELCSRFQMGDPFQDGQIGGEVSDVQSWICQ